MKLDVQTITTICLLFTIGLLGYLIHLMNPPGENYAKLTATSQQNCENLNCNNLAKIKCKSGQATCSCETCTGKGNMWSRQCNLICPNPSSGGGV